MQDIMPNDSKKVLNLWEIMTPYQKRQLLYFSETPKCKCKTSHNFSDLFCKNK